MEALRAPIPPSIINQTHTSWRWGEYKSALRERGLGGRLRPPIGTLTPQASYTPEGYEGKTGPALCDAV